jgi:hypothetical protein
MMSGQGNQSSVDGRSAARFHTDMPGVEYGVIDNWQAFMSLCDKLVA